MSHHQFSSFPPQGRPLFFHFTYISVCSCFNGFERNCNLFPYILLYFVRVCADKLCYQYCLLYFKLFRYYQNFLRKKVTLCISVKSLTPGISSKEFSAAILLLQVDRRRQKTLLGKVVKPVKLFVYIYRKVRLMKPTHDSLSLRVSCLRTHQKVFNEENSYHLVYIQAWLYIYI